MKKIKVLWRDVWENFDFDSEFFEGISNLEDIDYCQVDEVDSSGQVACNILVRYKSYADSLYNNVYGSWQKVY